MRRRSIRQHCRPRGTPAGSPLLSLPTCHPRRPLPWSPKPSASPRCWGPRRPAPRPPAPRPKALGRSASTPAAASASLPKRPRSRLMDKVVGVELRWENPPENSEACSLSGAPHIAAWEPRVTAVLTHTLPVYHLTALGGVGSGDSLLSSDCHSTLRVSAPPQRVGTEETSCGVSVPGRGPGGLVASFTAGGPVPGPGDSWGTQLASGFRSVHLSHPSPSSHSPSPSAAASSCFPCPCWVLPPPSPSF